MQNVPPRNISDDYVKRLRACTCAQSSRFNESNESQRDRVSRGKARPIASQEQEEKKRKIDANSFASTVNIARSYSSLFLRSLVREKNLLSDVTRYPHAVRFNTSEREREER